MSALFVLLWSTGVIGEKLRVPCVEPSTLREGGHITMSGAQGGILQNVRRTRQRTSANGNFDCLLGVGCWLSPTAAIGQSDLS